MDIVKFLTVEKHCDPMSQDILGNTVLHHAVLGGHLEIVKFLIEELKCPPDISGSCNKTPIHMAIHKNHLEIARYLQKHSVIPYIYTAIEMVNRFGLFKSKLALHLNIVLHIVDYSYAIQFSCCLLLLSACACILCCMHMPNVSAPVHSILQQGILCHRQVENTFQVSGDEESADKSQFNVDASGM